MKEVLTIQEKKLLAQGLKEVIAKTLKKVLTVRRKNCLTFTGIAWILSKHAKAARDGDPELVPSGVHPHTLRHSKAVHLLESGVNLIYIRDFLGHSSVTTTEIYARASTKAKREAIEKAAVNVIVESAYSGEERSNLVEWLKGLM